MSYRRNKPRIVKPRLKWVWRAARNEWEPNHLTTWTEGGKRLSRQIKLDWAGDAKQLDRLYWACESGMHDAQVTPARYTWGEAIIAWRKDILIQEKLADSTKKSYRLPMDTIMEKNGHKDIRQTTRAAVRASMAKYVETPRKATRFAQTISLLWNFAKKELDWPLGSNPAEGLGTNQPKRQYEPWPEWMVDALASAPLNVRTAAELILGTGQRPSAAISMRRDHFNGEWMSVRDEKGNQEFEVFCPQKLRAYIEALPRRGTHIIAKNLNQPVGYDAVEKSFRRWRKGLGDNALPYSLHGLRKLAIIQLAEADATDAQIQAITGQSAQMVAYYRSKASRRKLSKAGQERRT
ncbi:tyrosine-type recombinase/integrase [Sulfitobacter sp. M220]|uniref:tyrosine-type recombinase/integrase n=1 Tax=unclassified Sulfitobacter TaxID=196795 RepID=UPI0004E44112|nr:MULTISPECIES: tyrosine-type recombinase/integrase [unclassified Sulfitobacter]MCF7777327.1 tyrosine-type recombinase/integrase [Sulfitobacter sp. M220]PTA98972.1 hypothetical protein C8254_10960 [Sulfitobacter sp. CB-A]ULO18906.1 tyrosine-type recombinase/integrase [Sulfitobacter sp. CB2047]